MSSEKFTEAKFAPEFDSSTMELPKRQRQSQSHVGPGMIKRLQVKNVSVQYSSLCCFLTMREFNSRIGVILAVAFGSMMPLSPLATAQSPVPAVDPRAYGFDIPVTTLAHPEKLFVLTDDREGQPVVGKVHAELGDYCIVLLPDGHLVARHRDQSPETDRPFDPATPDQLESKLKETFGEGFTTKSTKNYVYAYNCSEKFAYGTARILESMRPGVKNYVEKMRIETHDPLVPLVAIMFRTESQFQRYRRMPPGVVAYYDTLTNHIVMYEESRLFRTDPELAIQQAISTIAHEGAHQILHNIGVQSRLSMWPMWLSEGLAEYFAPTTFGRKMQWKGAGQVNDLRMLELEVYIKTRGVDDVEGQLIRDTASAARLTSTGYAAAWSLTHFLAKTKRPQFFAYVREVTKLRPFQGASEVISPGIMPENLALFEKHFGDDLTDVENRLVAHLKKQPYTDPFASYPHFLATIEVREGRRMIRDANVFHSAELANIWIEESVKRLPDHQRASAQGNIGEVRNRLVAEQAARQFLRLGSR